MRRNANRNFANLQQDCSISIIKTNFPLSQWILDFDSLYDARNINVNYPLIYTPNFLRITSKDVL